MNATLNEVGSPVMDTSGGDRVMSGAEFRSAREVVCKDRQKFAHAAGVSLRTLAAFELGATQRPREYETYIEWLGKFQRGEVTDATPVVDVGETDEIDLGEGLTFTLTARDIANLGEYRAAKEIMRRVVEEVRRRREGKG